MVNEHAEEVNMSGNATGVIGHDHRLFPSGYDFSPEVNVCDATAAINLSMAETSPKAFHAQNAPYTNA